MKGLRKKNIGPLLLNIPEHVFLFNKKYHNINNY